MCEKLQSELDARAKIEVSPGANESRNSQTWPSTGAGHTNPV